MQCIRQFDAYVFTKFIQKNKSFCFLTDGPNDLLYTLRKECIVKGIRLAAYFDRFFDLCKEFNKFYPEYGASSMMDMCQCLGIARKTDAGALDNCRSIANIVASILREGYSFVEPEVIPVSFDPFATFASFPMSQGVMHPSSMQQQPQQQQPPQQQPLSYKGAVAGQVFRAPPPVGSSIPHTEAASVASSAAATSSSSTTTAMSGNVGASVTPPGGSSGVAPGASESPVVRLRGLPWDATDDDLIEFFQELSIEEFTWTFTHRNRPSGEAFVRFSTVEDAVSGLGFHKKMLGKRYIEVFASTVAAQDMAREASRDVVREQSAGGGGGGTGGSAGEKKSGFKGDVNQTLVMMYGLPYTVTVDEIEEFFEGFSFIPGSVEIDTDDAGRAVGTGQIDFSKPKEAQRAIADRNRKFIGKRYVNLHMDARKKKQQLDLLLSKSNK